MINGLFLNLFLDVSLVALPIAFLVLTGRNLKRSLNELGFNQIKLGKLLKNAGKIFLALLAASIWLSLALNFLGLNDLYLVSESLERARAILPIFFWIVILRVVSEEVFFRGFLVKRMGVVLSSVVYALFHVGYWSFAEVIGA